jgi:YD repeat-containing protein
MADDLGDILERDTYYVTNIPGFYVAVDLVDLDGEVTALEWNKDGYRVAWSSTWDRKVWSRGLRTATPHEDDYVRIPGVHVITSEVRERLRIVYEPKTEPRTDLEIRNLCRRNGLEVPRIAPTLEEERAFFFKFPENLNNAEGNPTERRN